MSTRKFLKAQGRAKAIRILHRKGFKIRPESVSNRGLCRRLFGYSVSNRVATEKLVWLASQDEFDQEVSNRGRLPKAKPVARIADPFYSSPVWKRLREDVLSLYGADCMVCRATSDQTEIHVDHIKPRKKFPLLELDICNLQVLCKSCNLYKSDKYVYDVRSEDHKRKLHEFLQLTKWCK